MERYRHRSILCLPGAKPALAFPGQNHHAAAMPPTLSSCVTTEILAGLVAAAEAAGQAAQRFHAPGARSPAKVSYKASNSPVTEADFAADAVARKVLAQHFPDVPILSEEDEDGHGRIDHGRVLVIDPIDGTRAFIAGRSEWCVSLALLDAGRPVAGVIAAPARNEVFAAAKGLGATLNGQPLPRRPRKAPDPLRVTGPNRLIDTLTEHWPAMSDGETLKALAYRLVSVAAGSHDVAVATLGSNHWDIAAADIILAETGCCLLNLTGGRPVYIGPDPLHPALIAAEETLGQRLVAAIARVPA
jgi:myo-inositol-1(or 4)-monophosphatase